MAQNRTDDTGRFMNAIAAFSAAPELVTASGRLIASSGKPFVDSMLTEINETVLRRIVHFSTQSGDMLSVDVSERRIHRIRSLPRALDDKLQHMLGRSLTAQDAAAFLDIAETFGQMDNSFYAKASLPEMEDAQCFDGLSLQDIQAAKNMAGSVGMMPEIISAAIFETRKCALATCMELGDANSSLSGEEKDTAALERLRAKFLKASHSLPFVRLWQGTPHAENAVLVAATADISIAVLIPSSQKTPQFVLWRKAVLQEGS